MLLNKQFQDTIKRIGLDDPLSDQERMLAEIVWSRCESAMMQKSPQTAALLKSRYVHSSSSAELTREDWQYLTHILKLLLNNHDEEINLAKIYAQEHWKMCDPDKPETKYNFEKLNTLRDIQRQLKTRRNKLSIIQRKLKKLR